MVSGGPRLVRTDSADRNGDSSLVRLFWDAAGRCTASLGRTTEAAATSSADRGRTFGSPMTGRVRRPGPVVGRRRAAAVISAVLSTGQPVRWTAQRVGWTGQPVGWVGL